MLKKRKQHSKEGVWSLVTVQEHVCVPGLQAAQLSAVPLSINLYFWGIMKTKI